MKGVMQVELHIFIWGVFVSAPAFTPKPSALCFDPVHIQYFYVALAIYILLQYSESVEDLCSNNLEAALLFFKTSRRKLSPGIVSPYKVVQANMLANSGNRET